MVTGLFRRGDVDAPRIDGDDDRLIAIDMGDLLDGAVAGTASLPMETLSAPERK
jgi:hypothetical protein